MLSKNEFFDSVKRNIINFLPDEVREGVEIDETTIVKMNDQKLHGIVIKDKGADAAPNFYLDEMCKAYDLLKFKKNKEILDNIVFLGLRKKTEEVLKGESKNGK